MGHLTLNFTGVCLDDTCMKGRLFDCCTNWPCLHITNLCATFVSSITKVISCLMSAAFKPLQRRRAGTVDNMELLPDLSLWTLM